MPHAVCWAPPAREAPGPGRRSRRDRASLVETPRIRGITARATIITVLAELQSASRARPRAKCDRPRTPKPLSIGPSAPHPAGMAGADRSRRRQGCGMRCMRPARHSHQPCVPCSHTACARERSLSCNLRRTVDAHGEIQSTIRAARRCCRVLTAGQSRRSQRRRLPVSGIHPPNLAKRQPPGLPNTLADYDLILMDVSMRDDGYEAPAFYPPGRGAQG